MRKEEIHVHRPVEFSITEGTRQSKIRNLIGLSKEHRKQDNYEKSEYFLKKAEDLMNASLGDGPTNKGGNK